jgi:hypothetical protein
MKKLSELLGDQNVSSMDRKRIREFQRRDGILTFVVYDILIYDHKVCIFEWLYLQRELFPP